ncbi:MAG: hypothetical protein IJM03_05360 [Treponema sp.]|nr:hypothetical protein [Treponema sp.]
MKNLFATLLLLFIFISCTTNKIKKEEEIYDYISKNIMCNAQSVILEATKKEINPDDIKISGHFGERPGICKKYYCDYISYPYYSIRKFCSALDGTIVYIGQPTNYPLVANAAITVKTDGLEIEYFGLMWLNKELSVGSKIEKGTYLGTMKGGGDSGMVLNIRMRYDGKIIDPSRWFTFYDFAERM